jgi:protein-S-isoprenylcysteine O-methyltransferase Ste14
LRLLRAVTAFLLLPGTIAYLVPLMMASRAAGPPPWLWAGSALMVAGTLLLLWCVRDFYVSGKGTLAPWSPPERLVTVGLYRVSRNPMYVAVLVVLVGWATRYRSTGLLWYAAFVAVAFHLRILFYEEPRLASFGDAWTRYRENVRRWF